MYILLKCYQILSVFVVVMSTNIASQSAQLNSSGMQSRGAYICITGQQSRLELTNKVDKLLKPLHEMGYKVYIGLALATGSSHFTNVNNGDKMKLISSIDQAMQRLRSVPGVQEVRYFPPYYDKNIYVNMRYKDKLDNANSVLRVKNHARQYKTLQYCNEWHNISLITQLTIRVRDDILFERVDVPMIVNRVINTGAVVSAACDAWAGMNDKVAFLPSSISTQFFQLPYSTYVTFNASINALNPEKFYSYAYSSGISMESDPDLFVAKAVTQLLPTLDQKSKHSRNKHFRKFKHGGTSAHAIKESFQEDPKNYLCNVISNPHKSFSPGCEVAFKFAPAENIPSEANKGNFLSPISFGVSYKSKCWK